MRYHIEGYVDCQVRVQIGGVWAQKAVRRGPQAPWSGLLAGRISHLALLFLVDSGASVPRSQWKTCHVCLSGRRPALWHCISVRENGRQQLFLSLLAPWRGI